MSLTLISSVDYPLSLEDIKSHLRVEDNEDDEYILNLIGAAFGAAEHYTQIKIVESVYQYKLPRFSESIRLPVCPVQSVDLISYIDPDGLSQALGSFYFRNTPFTPSVLPAYGEAFPDVQEGYESITIDFTAGYSEVPKPIIQAVKMIVATLYEQREDYAAIELKSVPMSSQTLLDPYRAIVV